MAEHSPTATVSSQEKRRFNKKAIDANAEAAKREFRAYAEDRPALARMGARVGAAFMEALLNETNLDTPTQDVHQAIHFLAGWMIATSVGSGNIGGDMRKRLLTYAMTQTQVFAEAMSAGGNVTLPEPGEKVE